MEDVQTALMLLLPGSLTWNSLSHGKETIVLQEQAEGDMVMRYQIVRVTEEIPEVLSILATDAGGSVLVAYAGGAMEGVEIQTVTVTADSVLGIFSVGEAAVVVLQDDTAVPGLGGVLHRGVYFMCMEYVIEGIAIPYAYTTAVKASMLRYYPNRIWRNSIGYPSRRV